MDITAVDVVEGHVVHLRFADGSERTIDLEPYLRGPVFERVRTDPNFFASVHVDREAGTIVWPNDAEARTRSASSTRPCHLVTSCFWLVRGQSGCKMVARAGEGAGRPTESADEHPARHQWARGDLNPHVLSDTGT
jgi:Protein of unknown function (DUF2442)